MNRRTFLKGTTLFGSSLVLPTTQLFAADENSEAFSQVKFSETLFNDYNSQSIVIFLYGGSSELAGNLSNYDDINRLSENSYPSIEITEHGFWQEAGGDVMEELLAAGNMSIVRTMNRVVNNTRSHGLQQMENMKGSTDIEKAGFFRDILEVLHQNGQVTSESIIPAITLSESVIYSNGNLVPKAVLNPVTVGGNLENPYDFGENSHVKEHMTDKFNALLQASNSKSRTNSYLTKLSEQFFKREELNSFMTSISEKTLPVTFPDTTIGDYMSSTLKLMLNNSDTKLAFVNYPGSWDDHSNAVRDYRNRFSALMDAIKSSVDTLKAVENKTVNIWVMTEFGRNVNLNDSGGWDHGNQFNLMLFSNSDKFKMGQVIGETEVFSSGGNRLYTRPKEGSVSYEPYSIASTLYKVFGIENPEAINGYPAIDTLI